MPINYAFFSTIVGYRSAHGNGLWVIFGSPVNFLCLEVLCCNFKPFWTSFGKERFNIFLLSILFIPALGGSLWRRFYGHWLSSKYNILNDRSRQSEWNWVFAFLIWFLIVIIGKCCDEVLVSEAAETNLVAGQAVIKVVGHIHWRKKGGDGGGQY